EVRRLARIDLVLHPIQTGHQQRGEAEVRVGGGIRATELDPLALFAFRIDRDPDRRGAIALRVDQVDRRLEARHQAAVGVYRRRREGQQGRRVLEQAADVVLREAAQPG